MAASCPWRTSSFESSTTCFCAPPKVSSLMTNSTRIGRLLVESFGGTHPALAPHLEGEQVPELLRVEPVVVGTAVAKVGDSPLHDLRIEEPALADAPGREVLVDERCELAAQPTGERHREALLRTLEQLAWHVLVQDAAREMLRTQRAAAR